MRLHNLKLLCSLPCGQDRERKRLDGMFYGQAWRRGASLLPILYWQREVYAPLRCKGAGKWSLASAQEEEMVSDMHFMGLL